MFVLIAEWYQDACFNVACLYAPQGATCIHEMLLMFYVYVYMYNMYVHLHTTFCLDAGSYEEASNDDRRSVVTTRMGKHNQR